MAEFQLPVSLSLLFSLFLPLSLSRRTARLRSLSRSSFRAFHAAYIMINDDKSMIRHVNIRVRERSPRISLFELFALVFEIKSN